MVSPLERFGVKRGATSASVLWGCFHISKMPMSKTSELPGFYRLDMAARRARVAHVVGIDATELQVVSSGHGLTDAQADHMVENALGVMGMPLGLCVNLRINGRDHLLPMAVEEPSVVAACSYASKLLRAGGGVTAELAEPLMIGQIQVMDVVDPVAAGERVLQAKGELVALANAGHKGLVGAGGGVVDIEVRHLEPMGPHDPCGAMLVFHLIVDVRDAMGANAINTMCERLAPRIAAMTGGRVGLRILSNLSDRRLVTVTGRVPVSELEGKGCDSGLSLARCIEEASVFAERDPYRAATHNKGIMNGVDAAVIALGQDWRAVEAGAHAYASRGDRYTALATWRVEPASASKPAFLVGRMTLPMAVGTVGGVVHVHPTVKANRLLAGIESTADLAGLVTAAGLAQNLSALRALAAEGIQSGHMRLHARNVAIQAGAEGDQVQRIADLIADRREVNLDAARSALRELLGTADPVADAACSDEARAACPQAAACAGGPATSSSELDSGPPSGVAPRCPGAAGCTIEDRVFCTAMLPGVSRTFALSIQALPEDLRDAVCVSYLLCRVVDTIEDDRRVEPTLRQGLFDAFDLALAAATVGIAEGAAELERRAAEVSLGPTETERKLVGAAGAVFRVFAALPAAQRAAISPRVAEMARGMRAYALRADAEGGLRLRDIPDLEKYCYYVAGTVGELLTDLFALTCNVDAATRRELEARSIAFGLGLQLVNILKDVSEDIVRGDCFLPVETARELGLELERLLVPSERQKGLALLRLLSSRAREHLDRAEEYTLLWPQTVAVPAGGDVRLFCSVPLALALATLREIEVGSDALMQGRAPTVSRALVMSVFEEAVRATKQTRGREADVLLRGLFDKARTGVVGRPQRPTATPGSPTGAAPASPTVEPTPASTRASEASPTTSTEGVSMSGTVRERRDVDGLQPRREFGGKVFVTGAAGHVGANLVHRLVTEGRDVRVFLRPDSNNEAIDAIERETGKKVERVFGDLRDAKAVDAAIRGCNVAFHVAARVSIVGGTEQSLREIYDCNVIGTANLLRSAGEAGVARTVVTGSLSAVGYDIDDPSRPSDESMGIYPFSEHLPYGRTKQLVEHEVLKACVDGLDAVIATSCAVLGPYDHKPSRMGRLLLDFTHGRLRAYLPGGFDFVRARDLADGHVLALERGRRGHRYILSTGFASVDDLMEVFEEVSGRKRPSLRLPAGVMAGVAQVSTFVMSNFFPETEQRFTPASVRLLRMERKADTTKAQTELGYRPTTVRQAIHEAYADFARRGLVPQSPSLGGSATSSGTSVDGAAKSDGTVPKGQGRAGAAA